MSKTKDDRALAATIIRSVAAGASMSTSFVKNPVYDGTVLGAVALLNVVATLVESIGRHRAEEILRQLVDHPAEPVTAEQLAADVARIKQEFGIGT
jgi:hypothetical protein